MRLAHRYAGGVRDALLRHLDALHAQAPHARCGIMPAGCIQRSVSVRRD
jgi:hypothetical protein